MLRDLLCFGLGSLVGIAVAMHPSVNGLLRDVWRLRVEEVAPPPSPRDILADLDKMVRTRMEKLETIEREHREADIAIAIMRSREGTSAIDGSAAMDHRREDHVRRLDALRQELANVTRLRDQLRTTIDRLPSSVAPPEEATTLTRARAFLTYMSAADGGSGSVIPEDDWRRPPDPSGTGAGQGSDQMVRQSP
jgi:hypothetical protein